MDSLLTGIAHVGIRVANFERSRDFYGLLGFRLTGGPYPPEPVAILSHPSGIELNLIVNAKPGEGPVSNILMDAPEKYAGYTHVALACRDIGEAQAELAQHGVTLSGGPATFPGGHRAIFVRDPDGNVIELNQAPNPA